MGRPLLVVLGVLALGIGVTLAGWLVQSSPGEADSIGVGRDAAPTSVPQGHLYAGIVAEPSDYNPFTTTSATVRSYVLGFTHEALFDYDPETGELRGALAEAWQVAADGRSMTVKLRDGARFSDGSDCTVDDVLFTHAVASSAGVVLGSAVDGMAMVERVERLDNDPRQLRIVFDRKHFAAPAVVGTSWIVVNKRWFTERIAALAARDGGPAPQPGERDFGLLLTRVRSSPGPGTGPYRFADEASVRSLRKGRDLTLVRNRYAWSRVVRPGTWNLAGIRLLFLTDPAASFTAVVDRRVDWYSAPGVDELLARRPGLASDYKKVVYDRPTLGVFLVQWNCRQEHLGDRRVRRALSMLFDRQVIVDRIMAGHALPSVAFGKPGRPGYPHDLAPPSGTPEEVRRLVRAAGFDAADGTRLRVELMTPAGAPWYRRMADLAKDAAAKAGIDLAVREVAYELLVQRRAGHEWDGVLLMSSFDRHGDPFDLLHSEGAGNVMGWSHEGADQLIDGLRIEADPTTRADLLEQLHRLVDEEQPVALLVHPLVAILFNRHIEGAEPGPLGLWPERFWVAPEHQRGAR